ncbi:hypothetical protein ACJMK2_040572 [Sinanodonta woodiana]|uniref:Uncharacterized protein n=1 Tax=Sinanodonta woodiana TaxID=1069815 RepID=A0ABD3W2B4_SINWO
MNFTLRPSEIYYCQNTIKNVFDGIGPIGQTLNDIVDGHLSVNDLTPIRVCWKNNRWFALDNRRLWIFKHLERMGKIDEIDVKEISEIPPEKFTTKNDGNSIFVRGDPYNQYDDY